MSATSPPSTWAQREAQINTRVGELRVQQQILEDQLAEVSRQLAEAVKAAISIKATAQMAVEVEAAATEAAKPPPAASLNGDCAPPYSSGLVDE